MSNCEIMIDFGSIPRAFTGWVLLLVTITFLSSAFAGDPDVVYRTLRTENFNIHYEEPLEYTARLTASLAEEIHNDICVIFNWKVKKKVEVVITDNTDSANGSASVFGKPVIRMYATAPALESALQNYDHWLRALFVHEYTHIVHLSIRGRFPEFFNKIFGDIYLPNQLSPRWLIEGIAILMETHRTSGGRIRSSLYQMYIRTAALEGTLLNLGQVTNMTRSYLRGSHAYIYGAMFMEYVYQKYGMDKIVAFCHEYGKSPIPYGVNRHFKSAFGQTVEELYDEWIAKEKKLAQETRLLLEKEEITKSTALTSDGEEKGSPIFDSTGRYIYVPIGNGLDETAVYKIDLQNNKKQKLAYSNASSQVSIDRAGRLFYTRSAPHKNNYFFQDLFVLESEDSSPRRITQGMRTKYAAISPKGDRAALSVNNAGTSKLILTDDRGNIIDTLIDSPHYDQVYNLTWSPDGNRVAAVIRKEHRVDLVLIDADTKQIQFVTEDRFIESSPVFTSDGKYLIFSSDRTGISNIFAYDFANQTLLQLTNVLSGAYSPAISPDSKTLVFVKYSSKGYDLHLTQLSLDSKDFVESANLLKEKNNSRLKPLPPTPVPDKFGGPSKPYNPFPSMVPNHWMLGTSIDPNWNTTISAATSFADVTNRHNAGAEIVYDTNQHTASGRIGYAFYGIGPSIHVGVSRQYLPRDTGYRLESENKEWMQVVTRGSLSLSFPVFDVDSNHSLRVGYDIIHAKPQSKIDPELDPRGELPEIPTQYFRSGLSLGWGYSDTISSPLGIGPHKGRSLSFGTDLYHPALGGTQKMLMVNYRWSEYVPMPFFNHHVLALSLSGGARISSPPNESAYTVGGQTEMNFLDTIINNTANGMASLRGYMPNAFKGSRYHLLKINYRFPLWFTEAGYGTIPIYLRRIQASLFSDQAIISFEEFNREDWRASIGAEISWSFTLGFYQDMSLRTGYAYGLMDGGIHEVILVLSGGM